MPKKESKELAKVEPSRDLSPFEEMERRIDEFFRKPFSLFGPTWFPRLRMPEFEEMTPSVDIFEEGHDVVLKAELPGMKKEDIEVKLTEDMITLSGEKKKEEKIEKKNYHRLERSYGSFYRSFRLPDYVDVDHIEAKSEKGLLKITLPKRPELKPKKVKILPVPEGKK
jgi:HSP20 family protein